jgi:hypothetical protein
VHAPLQHSWKTVHTALLLRPQTGAPIQATELHVVPEPAQQSTTPQKSPASPQQLPPTHW